MSTASLHQACPPTCHGCLPKTHETKVPTNQTWIGQGPFQCDKCSKVYSKLSSLRIHRNQKHPITPRIPCPYCNKTFMDEAHQNIHRYRFHVAEVRREREKGFCIDKPIAKHQNSRTEIVGLPPLNLVQFHHNQIHPLWHLVWNSIPPNPHLTSNY